jgi:CHAT domain-containing protein
LVSCFLALLCARSIAQQTPAASKPDNSPSEAAKPAEVSPAIDPVGKARELLRKAEIEHPGNTVEVADALNNLVGIAIEERHNPKECLELAQRELAVAEAAAGPKSKVYVNALGDIASVDVVLSKPTEAVELARRAYEIAEKEFPQSEEFVSAATTLASACEILNDRSCELHADEAALAVARKLVTDDQWPLIGALSNIYNVKDTLGDMAGAGVAIEEALAIAERKYPNDVRIPMLEMNAGEHFVHTLEFEKAMAHYNHAADLFKQSYGADSPALEGIQGQMAGIHTRMGNFQAAWKIFETNPDSKTFTIEEQIYGDASFAASLASGGELKRAIEHSLKSAQMGRERFVLQARSLPERQALGYNVRRAKALDVALSVLGRHPEMVSEAIYQEVIRSRALVADEMARRQKNLNANNDPEVARLLGELKRAREDQLASEKEAPNSSKTSGAVPEATNRMEKIERELAERSAAIRDDERSFAVGLDDVRRGLPAGAALISYVAYGRTAVEKVDPTKSSTHAYMAFVLRAGSDRIGAFDLGDAASLDELVRKARAAADAEAHSGGLGSARNERAYREAGEAIRARIWDPLKKEIGDAKLALVVADGNLNLIPFAGLPDGNGYLVEHGPVIHMLSSERDLVPRAEGLRKQGLLAVGSPSFGMALNRLPPSPLRGASPSCEEFGKIEFQPLPGTAKEISDIGTTWRRWNGAERAQLVTGNDATLSRFIEDAPQSRVLHVATHAFLLDKSCGNGNPLLHSGLVFAGGNHGAAQSILTAQQIASLDLSGVDWAVLSACNTGNGELRDGEGVLGLQRAFRVAGAHSVIMTLWPVDDDAARQFMHELYAQRLGQHATTADAVWNSSRKILLERRAEGKSTNPWYWAGFVGSGGWE